MRHFSIIFLVITFLISCGHNPQNDISIINIEKKYPIKQLTIQEIWNVKYVPLDTDDTYLVPSSTPDYLSDNHIGFINHTTGDILFWNSQTGEKAFIINRKGPGPEEYKAAGAIVLDEKNSKLYIWSIWDGTIQVYNTDGKYCKTLYMHNHKKGEFNDVTNMINANDSLLICSVNNMKGYTLHFYLNKLSGNTRLIYSIPQNKVVSLYIQENINGVHYSIAPTIKPIIKIKDGYIYADHSNDTIYKVEQGNFKTYIVREPFIQDMPDKWILRYHTETEQWIILSSVHLSYNFKDSEGLETKFYGIKKDTNEIFEIHFKNRDFGSTNFKFTGDMYTYLSNDILLNALNDGNLKNKLESITKDLTTDDNGVLMLLR